MRILVFADSHGDTDQMISIIKLLPDVSHIIHLGDIYRDVLELEAEFSDIEIHFVQGNNDPNHDFDTERLIFIGGVPIFMTHGHHYSINVDNKSLLRSEKAREAKIILYGHTHVSDYEIIDGKIVANPGSISRPRYGLPSYGIIEIEGEKVGYSNISVM